jgi:nucleoside-diphosphate-sugar epimerase
VETIISKNTQLRIVVTGATGFLGNLIVQKLSSQPDLLCIAACRNAHKMAGNYNGEIMVGDLTDSSYCKELAENADMIIHAGTWAAMWGHRQQEQHHFYRPARELINQAIQHGVKRFIMTSTVAIGEVSTTADYPHDDFSESTHCGYWPHLDRLMDIDREMREKASCGTQMVNLRLGHFVGRGNRIGLIPALLPRLKTHLVPWLGDGSKRLPLVADTDLARAFLLAVRAKHLCDYESFNICGPSFPRLEDVVMHIAKQARVPAPHYRVPYSAGYAFGWLMESIHPLLPVKAPFLTRSFVRLCEDWYCPNTYALDKLGYVAKKDWRKAIDEQIQDLKQQGYPWPALAQL